MPEILLLTEDVTSGSGAGAGVADVLQSVTTQFTPGTIVTTLGIVLGSCVTLYLLWWGARKGLRMIKSALNGKLKI